MKRLQVCLLLVGLVSGYAQDSVVLNVAERAGVARNNECVISGVPVPLAWNVTDVAGFAVQDSIGNYVPAQFDVLARWGGASTNTAKAVKWVLVSFDATVAANGAGTFTFLKSGDNPWHNTPVSIETNVAGRITVDTGVASFELDTLSFNLFNQVTVSGQTLLETLAATNVIAYNDIAGTSIVAGGAPDFTPRTTSVTIERSGPVYAVLKVMGSILDNSGRALLDFTARLHFYAGSPDVRVDFTVENNQPLVTGGYDQPTNVHNQGSVNSVYAGNLQLNLKLKNTGAAVRVLTEQNVDVSAPASAVMLYQDASGTTNWSAYVGMVGWPGQEALAHPRLQSYCSIPGYIINGPGIAVTGMQAMGWMNVSRSGGPGVTAAVRWFRENFPNCLQASTDGVLTFDMFPNGTQFRHNFRVGEEKTHTVLYRFGSGDVSAVESENLSRAFNSPLFAVAPASWYVRTAGAFPEMPVVDLVNRPLYERYVRIAFEPNPDFDPSVDDPSFGNRTLTGIITNFNMYGWQDFGDVPIDYEAFGNNQAGQLNLKYWFLYGMLAQFCRSTDMNWLDIAIPAAWHMADIDILHIADGGPTHWSHGAYFGHSQHEEPGNTNPNRNENSPSVDLFFGVPDLLLAYHLTGETRFQEVAREALESMLNMSQFSDFTASIPERERANLIFGYIEGYKDTGDTRWLDELRMIVGYTASTANKPWLADPVAYGAANPGLALKMFPFQQVFWTLGKYLDFCSEYSLADDLGVANALGVWGDFIINFAMTEYAAGYACTPYEYFFDSSDPSYLDINNWQLVTADGMAYAYKYTGQQRYIDEGAKFYRTGVEHPMWEGDPPVYYDAKSLINSVVWGLVYMNQTASTNVVPDSPVPVYRFYSSGAPESTYTHLWTINETERDVLLTYPSWQYEGIGWYAMTGAVSGSTPLYRLYEPNIRRHLYTINATEYVALQNTSWNGEGAQYYVYASSQGGVVPVFRFYHSVNQNHHFTIDANERDTIIATPEWGYTYEGVGFYVYQTGN